MKDLQTENRNLQNLLYAMGGAAAVLLITALDQGVFGRPGGIRYVSPFTPWMALWILLQTFSVLFAVGMVALKPWHEVPFEGKAGLFFGYTAISWVCLLAFGLRLIMLFSLTYFIVVSLLGIILVAAVLIYRARSRRAGEDFP